MDINKFSPKFKVSSPNLINLSGLTTEDIFEYLYAANKVPRGRKSRSFET